MVKRTAELDLHFLLQMLVLVSMNIAETPKIIDFGRY